jgi:hypothetical protein
VIDWDLRILELAVEIELSHAQLGNLAGGSRDRCLVTLAAGLGVVERSESIRGDAFDLLEKLLVRPASLRIGKSVALVVESGDGFRGLPR